ncbi:HdeD family acid-resistance protein [Methanoculleus chikugoensis]|uniref:Acid-resistance membrane protein n=1 Tax=Methanoculleus chikugoensis TaxID=118126 RepID=A0ABN5XJ92_9EURY|nr:DUF308 domain-containing protein [Methanoculleus chikugoensis]BBL68768.1 hypothetical protein MchiMG62_19490 [Methanoculleus chikugoensis]
MSTLESYLDALHQGVFQVVVPKALVTEPLEPGWKQSAINVPSPDTIASYRKGRYHAHETVSEYRVHMDRYDPEKNPIMHLIDDAPLALMLHETMETVFVTGKDATRRDPLQRLADQHMTWKFRMGLGIVLVAIGVTLLLTAFYGTLSFFAVTLPALVLILGLIAITKGVQQRNRKEHADKDIIRGSIVAIAGIALFIFWKLYLILILLVLAVWLFSSAVVTLLRAYRERASVTKGFWYTLGLGVSSLVLGILAITLPGGLVRLLIFLLAGIVLMAGAFMVLDGYGLRNAARLMEEGGVSR